MCSLIRYLINGEKDAINPKPKGTKISPYYLFDVEAGESVIVKMRLSNKKLEGDLFGRDFDNIFSDRIREADDYYTAIIPAMANAEQRLISRQSYAGQLILMRV